MPQPGVNPELLPAPTAESPPAATDALARVADCAEAEKAEATRRAYRSDFLHFCTWCSSSGRTALPASVETAAAYLTSLADGGLKASTITRRCAALACAHKLRGLKFADRHRAGQGGDA